MDNASFHKISKDKRVDRSGWMQDDFSTAILYFGTLTLITPVKDKEGELRS